VGCFWPMPPWLDLAELALTAGLASLCLIGRRMRMGKKQHAAAAGTAPHAGAAARQDRAERWRRGWSGWGRRWSVGRGRPQGGSPVARDATGNALVKSLRRGDGARSQLRPPARARNDGGGRRTSARTGGARGRRTPATGTRAAASDGAEARERSGGPGNEVRAVEKEGAARRGR
jgi:hypothetical protein